MDAKKFMQLVEEKKKRALEKKEAPLKWEQKLEAAAKADDEAKERKRKSAKHKRRSVSESDSDSDSDSSSGDRKSRKRRHKKHRKHAHSDSGDSDKRKEKKSRRKPKRRTLNSDDDSSDDYEYSSDEDRKRKKHSHKRHRHHDSRTDSSASDSSGGEDDAVKRRGQRKRHRHHHRSDSDATNSSIDEEKRQRRRHAKHHKRHRRSDNGSSDSFCDEDDGAPRRKSDVKHHNYHRRSLSADSKTSDSDFHRENRSQSLGKLSDDDREEAGKQMKHKKGGHHHHKHRHHHSVGEEQVEPTEKPCSLNFDSVLSVVESLCIVSSAILSIGFVVNCVVSSSTKTVLTVIGSRLFGCGVVALVAGVGIGAWIRKRQWGRISRVSARGRLEVNLLERIEKLEEDLRSYATMIRVMSRQLEKLGIRFRVTRKAIKQPIAETAALAQKNSEATRALAIQEDILEKELGEIQKVLLAMQEQQQKQLELILAIGKTSKLWDTRQERNQEQETTISRKEQDNTGIPKSTAEGLKQKEAHQI